MSDPLTEARRLLFRADDILTGPDGASVWWAMQALADEVVRLRALIDKPKRDPLTDPRPGDVVRWRLSRSPPQPWDVVEVAGLTESDVLIAYLSTTTTESMARGYWLDWDRVDVEVLHTAPDEVTP